MLNRVSQEVKQKVMLRAFSLLGFLQSSPRVVGATSCLLANNVHLVELCEIGLYLKRLKLSLAIGRRVAPTVLELNSHIRMKGESSDTHVQVGGFHLVLAIIMNDVDNLIKERMNKVHGALADLADGIEVEQVGFDRLVQLLVVFEVLRPHVLGLGICVVIGGLPVELAEVERIYYLTVLEIDP